MAMLLHEPSLVPPVGIGGNPQLRGASAVDVLVKPTTLSGSISSDNIVLELMSAWGAPIKPGGRAEHLKTEQNQRFLELGRVN